MTDQYQPKPDHKFTSGSLKAASFDRKPVGPADLGHQRLYQLTLELILGVR